mgnify:CR=1 FL=1
MHRPIRSRAARIALATALAVAAAPLAAETTPDPSEETPAMRSAAAASSVASCCSASLAGASSGERGAEDQQGEGHLRSFVGVAASRISAVDARLRPRLLVTHTPIPTPGVADHGRLPQKT